MPEMTENQIQTAVIAHWRALALPDTLVAAIPNARAFGQPGLTRGLFDLLCISPTHGVVFMELKTSNGKLSRAQNEHALLLVTNHINFSICYGLDEAIAALGRWKLIRNLAHLTDMGAAPIKRRREILNSPPLRNADANLTIPWRD